MIALLLRVIFLAITTISNLISRAIFSFVAKFVVLLIHTCRVPGEATKGLLEQLAEAIKSVLTLAMGLIMEIIKSIVSKIFELIKDEIVESITSTSGSLFDLMDKTRESIQGAISDIPEALGGASEMVSTIASDLWNNYIEAAGHVWERA